MAFSTCFFNNRKPRKGCFFNRKKGDAMTINTTCYEPRTTEAPRRKTRVESRATACYKPTDEMRREWATHTVRMAALRGDLHYLRAAIAERDRALHSERVEARSEANSPWAPILDEDPCAAVPKGLNECRDSRSRGTGDDDEPLPGQYDDYA